MYPEGHVSVELALETEERGHTCSADEENIFHGVYGLVG